MQGGEAAYTTTMFDKDAIRASLPEGMRPIREGPEIADAQNSGRIQSLLDYQGSLITDLSAALNALESSIECALEPPTPPVEKDTAPVDGSQCIVAERISDFNESLVSLIQRTNSIRNRVQL